MRHTLGFLDGFAVTLLCGMVMILGALLLSRGYWYCFLALDSERVLAVSAMGGVSMMKAFGPGLLTGVFGQLVHAFLPLWPIALAVGVVWLLISGASVLFGAKS